jgi:sugar diacid utilization regulator
LIDENAATTARSLHIHRVLTQLVLDGGDLKDLARTMADLIGQSISIENEKFEALASHNIADVDEARRYTLVQGRTNPHLIAALEAGRYLQQIRASLRPVQLPRIPEVGLEMERILAPIVVHGDIYGYVWIIADDRPLSELDRLAIESGATIAALMLFYQETVISTEASLKGGLIAQLIELAGDAHVNGRDAVLTDQAMRYGVNLNAPFSALLVEMPSNDAAGRPSMNGQSDRLSSRALHTYRKVDHAIRAGEWRAVVGQFAGQILALAQHDDVTIPAIAAAMLDAFALEERAPGRIALSAQARGASGVAAAYHQCRDALNIAARLGDSRRIVPFETLGYLHTLYTSGIDGVRANPYVARLRPLIDETQADLFHTLDVYLDSGANGVGTAEQLHIHRSTLNYRLQQIEKICAVDLSDAILRTNLQVALKLIRLFG